MLVAVAFNIVVDMPSGPLDFVVSSKSKNSSTSSSVIKYTDLDIHLDWNERGCRSLLQIKEDMSG